MGAEGPVALLAGFITGATLHWAARAVFRRAANPPPALRSPRPWQPARLVAMPHLGWVPGAPQLPPWSDTGSWIPFDPGNTEDAAHIYALAITAIVPRPVALISSVDSEGVANLSPYSFFNAMCSNPLIIAVSVSSSPGRLQDKKDTLLNIQQTGEFVVNIISEWYAEAANHTCGDFDRGVDEMALVGLTATPSVKVRAPRVKESAVHMECRLREILRINDASQKEVCAVVIAEVVLIHVHEGVAGRSPTGKLVVDPLKLQPVARMGGLFYGRITELYDIGRPTKAQAQQGPAQYTASYVAAVAGNSASPQRNS